MKKPVNCTDEQPTTDDKTFPAETAFSSHAFCKDYSHSFQVSIKQDHREACLPQGPKKAMCSGTKS